MSTIKFTFSDLCAFFSRYPSRVMVGLISTGDQADEHVHEARITIRQDGVEKRVYEGFEQINGDITLDVHPKSAGLPHTRPNSVPKRQAKNGRQGEQRYPYNLVMSIDKTLYKGETLNVKANLCHARLHFNNGELYSLSRHDNVEFKDAKTGKLHPNGPFEMATEVGLEVTIDDSSYAVLHFSSETEDFVFKGEQDYEVEVVNRAEAVTGDHFKYFYNIVRPKPKHLWVPDSRASSEREGRMTAGQPACTAGDFSGNPPPPQPSGPKARSRAKLSAKSKTKPQSKQGKRS